jgi:hypothetical protein
MTKKRYYNPIYVHVSALRLKFYTKISSISRLPLEGSFISEEIIIMVYARKVGDIKWSEYKGMFQNGFVEDNLSSLVVKVNLCRQAQSCEKRLLSEV